MVSIFPLLAPDDDEEINPVILARVWRSLTARDLGLLQRLRKEKRIDVDSLNGYSPGDILWMAFYSLVGLDVDPGDRVFLKHRKEGDAAVDAACSGGIVEPKPRRPNVVTRLRKSGGVTRQ